MLIKARIGQTLFMCFLISSLYFQLSDEEDQTAMQNRYGALFFSVITCFMPSMMGTVLTFPAERAIFLKEVGSNTYSVSAYFMGRQMTEIPITVLFPAIQALITYYIIGFNDYNASKVFIYMVILML